MPQQKKKSLSVPDTKTVDPSHVEFLFEQLSKKAKLFPNDPYRVSFDIFTYQLAVSNVALRWSQNSRRKYVELCIDYAYAAANTLLATQVKDGLIEFPVSFRGGHFDAAIFCHNSDFLHDAESLGLVKKLKPRQALKESEGYRILQEFSNSVFHELVFLDEQGLLRREKNTVAFQKLVKTNDRGKVTLRRIGSNQQEQPLNEVKESDFAVARMPEAPERHSPVELVVSAASQLTTPDECREALAAIQQRARELGVQEPAEEERVLRAIKTIEEPKTLRRVEVAALDRLDALAEQGVTTEPPKTISVSTVRGHEEFQAQQVIDGERKTKRFYDSIPDDYDLSDHRKSPRARQRLKEQGRI